MDLRTRLLSAAERLFDRHGFNATGMDRLTEAAGMSSRTLYKQAGSKTQLLTEVLTERDRRFRARLDVRSLDGLFAALEDWIATEGARGCLFLRSYGETGGDTPEVAAALAAHKEGLRDRIAAIVADELDGRHDAALAEQILVLFEGATAAAVYRGADSVRAARAAALALVERARR